MLANGSPHYVSELVTDATQSYMPPRVLPSGLGIVPEGSQYALQQQHLPLFDDPNASPLSPSAKPVNPNGGEQFDKPVRRRISRACDQCNQLRTKCDGKQPCAHCENSDLTCKYVRAKKKRGKASKKDSAAQQAAPTNVQALRARGRGGANSTLKNGTLENITPGELKLKRSGSKFQPSFPAPQNQIAGQRDISNVSYAFPGPEQPPSLATTGGTNTFSVGMPTQIMGAAMGGYRPIDMNNHQHSTLPNNFAVPHPDIPHNGVLPIPNSLIQTSGIENHHREIPYAVILSPNGSHQGTSISPYVTESPLSTTGQSNVSSSPGWITTLPSSPSSPTYPATQTPMSDLHSQYSALQPLLPYVTDFPTEFG